jgi:pyruvate/2-oxoglutarate dehydrogenase complex dihydrolipoamide acyltransferase (E2) component
MAISVVMPALEMAQETGKVISWLKKEGEPVSKGEPLLEIETDKGREVKPRRRQFLAVAAREGAVIPVGQPSHGLSNPARPRQPQNRQLPLRFPPRPPQARTAGLSSGIGLFGSASPAGAPQARGARSTVRPGAGGEAWFDGGRKCPLADCSPVRSAV